MSVEQSTPVEWREHPSHHGYRVSTDGRVQSRWTKISFGKPRGTRGVLGDTWRELKVQRLPNGYRYVSFQLHGPDGKSRRKNFYVHRLMAELFIGPCTDSLEVAHGNGDRGDNRVENLRYTTRAGNMADTLTHGTRQFGSRHQNAKLTEGKVAAILVRVATGEKDKSVAADFGVCAATVWFIRHGRLWPHVPRPAGLPLPALVPPRP